MMILTVFTIMMNFSSKTIYPLNTEMTEALTITRLVYIL